MLADSLYFPILRFLNIRLDCTSKFFQIPKETENEDYWILLRKHHMNKSEWKFEVSVMDIEL